MRETTMVRHMLAPFISLLVTLLGVASLYVPLAFAASTSTGSDGLKVSPVATNLTMNPGDTQVIELYVQNVTGTPVTLQAIVNDFTAGNNENGTPALLLDPGQTVPGHSLKQFVAPTGNVTLKAGEEKVVKVSITIPKGTTGGGYYGAVRFAPVSASGDSNVMLSASVGSLILVRVPGTYKEDVQLASFDVSQDGGSPRVIFTSSSKLSAMARFRNDGDVQEQPFGKVILKSGNKQLATYEINSDTPRGNVLPDSIRRFTVNLDKVGAFGAYTLVGNFGYGTNGQLVSGTTTFYVVPIGLVIAAVAAIVFILLCIFGLPKLVRAYNRRILQKAGRR